MDHRIGDPDERKMDSCRQNDRQSLAGRAFRSGRLKLGASFRFGRARGAFCHSGWCQQCKVELDDGRVGLACQLPAEDLKKLKTGSGWKAPISLIARLMRPWFHESVILRPAFLQQLFLAFVRNASRALPLGTQAPPRGKAATRRCDTLVVGGGEAGVAAMESLQELGVDAILIDEGAGRGWSDDRFIPGISALGIYQEDDERIFVLCAGKAGSIRIFFDRVVVATGTYDRLLPVTGNDLPGIVGLNAFRKLVESGSLDKARIYGLFAPEAAAGEAAELARAAGIRFQWAAGSPRLPDGIAERCFGSVHLTQALGRGRLKAVRLSNGRRERCDVLVVGYQQPRYELQLQAGQQLDWGGAGAAIEPSGAARFPLLTVGSAGGVTSDIAAHARAAVADWLQGTPPTRAESFEKLPGCADMDDGLIVCPCEDVRVGDVRKALRDGYRGIEHLKRRTGAATGPCQGKLCHSLLLQCLVEEGSPAALPTMRPLVRPMALASFAGGRDDG